MEISDQHLATVNRLGAIADDLGSRSEEITDVFTSPRMMAALLFRRLRTNLRGYMLMWHDGSYLNADILLRCIVEGTICLAANATPGVEFGRLVRGDAAATLKGAINVWRSEEFAELVKGGEKHLREVFAGEVETGSSALNWKALAEQAGHPGLYGLHKALSGASAHITGLSLMRGVVGEHETDEAAARALDHAAKTVNFASMASVVAVACRIQAQMLQAADLLAALDVIDAELNAIATKVREEAQY